VPGYIHSPDSKRTEISEPTSPSTSIEFKHTPTKPIKESLPPTKPEEQTQSTSKEEEICVEEEPEGLPKLPTKTASLLKGTPSVSRAGSGLRLADDIVAKLRRSEAHRQAAIEKNIEAKRLLTEGFGEPSGDNSLSLIEVDVLKHVLLREQLLGDLEKCLEVAQSHPISNSLEDRLECLIAYLRGATIELLDIIHQWREMAKELGKEEQFFFYRGQNYLIKLKEDTQRIEPKLQEVRLPFSGVFLLPKDDSVRIPHDLFVRCITAQEKMETEYLLEETTLKRVTDKLRVDLQCIDSNARKEVQKKLTTAVERLQHQAQEQGLLTELRNRQRRVEPTSIRQPTTLEPITMTPSNTFLTSTIADAVVGVRDNGGSVRAGVLQADGDDTSTASSSSSSSRSNFMRSASATTDEATYESGYLTSRTPSAVTAVSATEIEVNGNDVMSKASQNVLHFFRGIIFEVDMRLSLAEEVEASCRIQAIARGGYARKRTALFKVQKTQNEAAIRIQRAHRRSKTKTSQEKRSQDSSENAAVLIQSYARGRVARNRFSVLLFGANRTGVYADPQVIESTRQARLSAQSAADVYEKIAQDLGPPRKFKEALSALRSGE